MPKRSHRERVDRYERKIRKLLEKRRRYELPVTESSESEQDPASPPPYPLDDELRDEAENTESVLEKPTETQFPDVSVTQNETAPPSEDSPLPSIDPLILQALGDATDDGPQFGPDIHNNLTQLWLPLLKKGMKTETKEEIMKQYQIPGNCPLLQAPKLNLEISTAVTDMVRARDKKVEVKQNQLGAGISAVSRAITSLMTSDEKIDVIKKLSDGCRILCDLHFTETQTRVKMITPGLSKPFLNLIQDSSRDETLFGSSLPEKIKASKTLEKQGLQIKKNTTPKPTTVTQSTFPQTRPQGNWQGPSRSPSNRGGRGGQKRNVPTRRSAPAATSTGGSHKWNQNRHRAQTRR